MTFKSLFILLKKNMAVAASAVVLLACAGVFTIRDGQIRRLEADYDDLSVRRTRMLKNLKYAAGLPEDLTQLKGMLQTVESRLFHPEDLAGNQRYFYQLESATQVKLQNLQQVVAPSTGSKKDKKAAKKAAKSKYGEIVYEMNVTGSYERVLEFLRQLEEGSAFYRLEGFSIAPIRVSPTETAVGMRLGIQMLGGKS